LPVGAPIPGTAVHVVDRRDAVQPQGALGRVVITGTGVASGYLGPASQASAAFGWWSFDRDPVAGFMTDDLGYWLDDGGLRVEQRVGAERKLHGERFDLAAVESALASHPAVDDARVGIDGEGSQALLVANVVWSSAPDEAAVRQHLQERLPPIAVPRQMVGVDAVPRLANGKVDRTKGIVGPHPGPEALVNEAETQAAAVVARVLGEREVGPTTSLIELGCDSLDLIEIAEAVGIRFGPSDRLGEFFDDPTVATIAKLIAVARGASEDDGRPALLCSLGPRRTASRVRLVACPPAGSDAPVFQPLVAPLDGIADVQVLRRPRADRRPGTVAAWLEDHVRRAAGELLAEFDNRPLILCGYSVGFVVACLVASALNERGIRPTFLVGLNPTVPGTVPMEGQDVEPPRVEPMLAERWRQDLRLRSAVPRRLPEVEATLLLLGDDDHRRWTSVGAPAMAALPHPEVRPLKGPHIIDDETMAEIGHILAGLLSGPAR
jgi:acyl carrier protein